MATAPTSTVRTYSSTALAAWIAVGLLWFAGGSNYLTRTMLTTMRGSVIEDIPMSDAQFGLLTSAFLWLYALASPFGGFLADRFSRRMVVLVSLFAWSGITLVTAYVHTFELFLALRALLGLAQAFYIPAGVALIVDYHLGPTRALAGGIHLTGMIFGAVIGGIGGWIAEKHGWSQAYISIAVPNMAIGVLLFFFLRNAPREHPVAVATPGGPPAISLGDALRSLAKPGPYYYMVLCMSVQGAISWIIIAWMPTVMREQFQLKQGAAGFSTLGFLYGAQTIGLLIGGFWSDRWSLTNPRSRVIIPSLAILFATPFFWMTGTIHHISLTLGSLSLWGLAMGFLGANTMPIVCLVVDARFRATAIGILNACTAIWGGLAIYGIGALRDRQIGVSLILTFVSGGVLLCGLLLWMVNVSLKRGGLGAVPARAGTG
ncbi:MAG: MFS transporter [Opitutaceae bacterium]|nr:MFS transporter [Opitutaceae bacterium]